LSPGLLSAPVSARRAGGGGRCRSGWSALSKRGEHRKVGGRPGPWESTCLILLGRCRSASRRSFAVELDSEFLALHAGHRFPTRCPADICEEVEIRRRGNFSCNCVRQLSGQVLPFSWVPGHWPEPGLKAVQKETRHFETGRRPVQCRHRGRAMLRHKRISTSGRCADDLADLVDVGYFLPAARIVRRQPAWRRGSRDLALLQLGQETRGPSRRTNTMVRITRPAAPPPITIFAGLPMAQGHYRQGRCGRACFTIHVSVSRGWCTGRV